MTMEVVELLNRVFRTFLTGLLAAAPLALTVFACIWIVDFLTSFIGPQSAFGRFLGGFGLRLFENELIAYLIGLFITLILLYILGLIVQAGLSKRLQRFVDSTLQRVPVINTVYDASKNLIKLFDRKNNSDIKAMSAVMCRFGGHGGAGVLGLLSTPEPITIEGKAYYSVMIPTAPVPFGGAILYMPVEWVEFVDIGVEGLINVYMSMGVTSKDYLDDEKVKSPPNTPPST